MKRKQLLCAVLVLLLLFSVQPVAVAENIESLYSTTIDADCRIPIIKVTVPTRASVYINPLELPVSIDDIEGDKQIISTPTCIANESEVPLVVDVTVTGAVNADSDMKLSLASTKGTSSTEKSAFIYFEMHTANTEDPNAVQWDEAYDEETHLRIVERVPVTKSGIVTLAAKTPDGKVAEGGYGPFRLTGDAVAEPDNAWTSKDGIMVIVAFTFTPLPYPADAQ